MEVVEWSPAAKAIEGKVGGRKVFLVAATYAAVRDHVGFLVFTFGYKLSASTGCLCHQSRNMTFQGLSPERSKIEQLMEMDGAVMVGTKIKAPFGLVPEVYVLPMDNILATEVSSRPCPQIPPATSQTSPICAESLNLMVLGILFYALAILAYVKFGCLPIPETETTLRRIVTVGCPPACSSMDSQARATHEVVCAELSKSDTKSATTFT
ncbi:hypothetical protein M405DRAFT_815774, partial [Rhizopogon salebrosus TDB-379]